jgi:hypothetical protein
MEGECGGEPGEEWRSARHVEAASPSPDGRMRGAASRWFSEEVYRVLCVNRDPNVYIKPHELDRDP